MSSEQNSSRWLRVPWRLAGAAALLTIAALLWWSGTRETKLDKEITRRLAELRASGEPIDTQDLARLFPNPPPSEDAGELLTNVLVLAERHLPPATTPFIMANAGPARNEAMAETITQQLEAYRVRTKHIFTNWPSPWPSGLRFASHWERGMESNSVPNFNRTRALIHMLNAIALAAAERGDAAEATDALERGILFTQTLDSDSLVAHMIKQACVGLTVTVTERSLNRVEFSPAQLAHIAVALAPRDPNGLFNALRGEHVIAIWAFQEVRAGRPLTEVIGGPVGQPAWWKRALEKFKPRRKEYSDRDFLAYLSLCQTSLKTLALPPTSAMTNLPALMTAYSTQVTSEVAQAVPANWTKALRAHYEHEAKLATLRTALAVELFRLAHEGRIPANLNNLVPNHLPEVPRDIFDGQPLRFKILPRGYVLYSIGADGVDDGGLEKTNNATKYDVTITVER